MFEGEDAFVKGLQSGPDSTAMVDALFQDPAFLALWNYLKNCLGITIKLSVSPDLADPHTNTPRYGLWASPDLYVNPKMPQHVSNAAELIDTIIHELIHALMDVREVCGERDWPLPPGATDWSHDPSVPSSTGAPPLKKDPDSENKHHAEKHYGDGASDPDDEYLDMNDEAQEFIERIVIALLAKTAGDKPRFRLCGGPTTTTRNLKKLRGPESISKNWSKIRAITWEPDACWKRTSTARGWINECACAWCEMVVKYEDGTIQIDLIDERDTVTFDGSTVHFKRLAGWEKR